LNLNQTLALGGLVCETDDAQERVICHEGVKTGYGDRTIESIEGGLQHSQMNRTHDRTILPGDVRERTLMESNTVGIRRRTRLWIETQTIEKMNSSFDGLTTRQRWLRQRFHFKSGRPASPSSQGLVPDSGVLGELVREQTSKIAILGVIRFTMNISRRRRRYLIEHSRSTLSCAMFEHSLNQTIGLELVQMRARSIAMKTDCIPCLGGINRSLAATKGGQQRLTTLTREGTMRGDVCTFSGHFISIAHIHGKKETRRNSPRKAVIDDDSEPR